MLDIIKKIIHLPELRKRLLWTLFLLAICRVGTFIPLPGINTANIHNQYNTGNDTGALGFLTGAVDLFSGGGLKNGAIFALGVMPYISASIIFQLLGAFLPSIKAVLKEGESGQRKINQWTRYTTLLLCIIQGLILARTWVTGAGIAQLYDPTQMSEPMFMTVAVLCITAGTMFLTWIGDQIDEFGIGNGASLIITIGIISRLPAAIASVAEHFSPAIDNSDPSAIGLDRVLFLMILFFLMCFAVVVVEKAERRIPIQTPKRVGMFFRDQQHIPLKLNATGVMAIIFAQALLSLPMFAAALPNNFLQHLFSFLMPNSAGFAYYMTYTLLIFFFSFFYQMIQFDPNEQAENLKQQGVYIPGIRPGAETADYLRKVINRLTFAGSGFISIIALLPHIMPQVLGIEYNVSSFFGGTTLLIAIGVSLDMVMRIDSYLVHQRLQGFMGRGGRIKQAPGAGGQVSGAPAGAN
ncbi:MAG: preprotein translocase subunit SecY [Planctomycetota bacterium]